MAVRDDWHEAEILDCNKTYLDIICTSHNLEGLSPRGGVAMPHKGGARASTNAAIASKVLHGCVIAGHGSARSRDARALVPISFSFVADPGTLSRSSLPSFLLGHVVNQAGFGGTILSARPRSRHAFGGNPASCARAQVGGSLQ